MGFQCTLLLEMVERTLHRNMLFLLGLWCDTESVLDNKGESENSGNPFGEQVDNFPAVDSDGEVDQPVYEGPQTQSHTKQWIKRLISVLVIFVMTLMM